MSLHGAGTPNFEFQNYIHPNDAVICARILEHGDHGSKAISYFPLPALRPPSDTLVALLDVPPKATLHTPISISLTIRNYHPTRAANVTVHLEPDSLDAFVVSGVRNGRVPVLLPGSEEKLVWRMIPIECGYVKLPRIKVIDRRKAIPVSQSSGEPGAAAEASTGEIIKVIDLRYDMRCSATADPASTTENGPATILVLP